MTLSQSQSRSHPRGTGMGWYCLCLGVLCNQGVVVKLLAPVPSGDELMQSFPIIAVVNQNPSLYIIPMIDYIIIALEMRTTLKGHRVLYSLKRFSIFEPRLYH